MTEKNQMIYLSIHGVKDGMAIFKCGTRYDWYLIEKTSKYTNTTVMDENKNICNLSISELDWLPNSNILDIIKLTIQENNSEDKCPIIYSRSNYPSDNKKYISHVKTDVYKYPVIHTIPKSGVRYIYSKINNKGHFGESKIIFSDNGFNDVVIDIEGEYGMSENSMAIKVDNITEALNIKEALLSKKFKDTLNSCSYSSFRIDWRLFLNLKRDFWKEYVELCPIIQSMSAYEPRKKWMSKVETDEYKYKCVHSTPKSGVRYMYSKINTNGHFGVSKIIFGDSYINPIIDINGEYGMTQHAMAIKIDDIIEGENIKKAITSEKFNNFIKCCSFSSYAIDWNIFKNLRRTFYKEFI
jgi:hypothetical protein